MTGVNEIGIGEYNNLLRKVKYYCKKYYPYVEYTDITHDLLLEEVSERTLSSRIAALCKQYRGYYDGVVSIEDNSIALFRSNKTIEYKYCYHCEDIFPVEFFCTGTSYSNTCKWGLEVKRVDTPEKKEKRRKSLAGTKVKERMQLRDNYIIDLLKKNGLNKEDITHQMITEKRKNILEKRKKKVLH